MAKANVTWTQKVLAKFNLSEEGKVGLFGDSLTKELKKAIRDANREIKSREIAFKDAQEDRMEQFEDLRESYEALFLEVDMDRINTSTDRKAYTRVFTDKLLRKRAELKQFESDIKHYQIQHDAAIEEIKEKIKVTEELLAAIDSKEEKE